MFAPEQVEGFEHWLEIRNTSRSLSSRTKAYRRQAQLAILMLHQAPQLLGCLREIVLVQCEELQLLATVQIVQQSSRPDLVEVVPCQIQLRNRRERATLITPRHLCDTERGDAIVPQAQFLDMGAAGQRFRQRQWGSVRAPFVINRLAPFFSLVGGVFCQA